MGKLRLLPPSYSLLPNTDAEGDWVMAQTLGTNWLRIVEELPLDLVPKLIKSNILLQLFRLLAAISNTSVGIAI